MFGTAAFAFHPLTNIYIGRRVLAKVLGLKTVHWKDCVLPFDGEVKDAAAFKEAFKPFDFSL